MATRQVCRARASSRKPPFSLPPSSSKPSRPRRRWQEEEFTQFARGRTGAAVAVAVVVAGGTLFMQGRGDSWRGIEGCSYAQNTVSAVIQSDEQSSSQGRRKGEDVARVLDTAGVRDVGIRKRGRGRRKKQNTFVTAAAERVGPAVVRIDTGVEGSKDRKDTGSGFILNGKEGLVVTNAHVLTGLNVVVTLTDGRKFIGTVRGTDRLRDVALVEIELSRGETLPEVALGDSEELDIGDWVIALGNPFGLENTITLGIISNLRRSSEKIGIASSKSGENVDFLQTDCAINPGSSGGPLVNEFGEVIGITTAIQADAEGIGFAIPMNVSTHALICNLHEVEEDVRPTRLPLIEAALALMVGGAVGILAYFFGPRSLDTPQE